MSRIDWLKLVIQYGRRKYIPVQILSLIIFEVYYQLCTLRGYKPRHFIEPLPEALRSARLGEPILMVWPPLPLSIRLLDRIVPRARSAHAEFMAFTAEAEANAKRAGRRTATVYLTPGVLKVGSN